MSDIHIYHNTIINSEEVRLGSNGNNPPSNVIIANNIFTNSTGHLFSEDTENETWIGNLYFGTLGIDSPSNGLSNTDPVFYENTEDFFQPESNSPAIAAAGAGYPAIPLYPQMEYDHKILFDLMKGPRPEAIADRAVGASEFSLTTNVQPHANELNTGPSYLFDDLINYIAANTGQLYFGDQGEIRSIMVSSNMNWTVMSNAGWISTNLSSGSGDAQLDITIDANEVNVNRSGTLTIAGGTESVSIDVYQDAGEAVSVLEILNSEVLLFPNPTDGRIKLSNLPSGMYSVILEIMHLDGRSVFSKEYRINNNELVIDFDKLVPGTYILNIKFIQVDGDVYTEFMRKIVRN